MSLERPVNISPTSLMSHRKQILYKLTDEETIDNKTSLTGIIVLNFPSQSKYTFVLTNQGILFTPG